MMQRVAIHPQISKMASSIVGAVASTIGGTITGTITIYDTVAPFFNAIMLARNSFDRIKKDLDTWKRAEDQVSGFLDELDLAEQKLEIYRDFWHLDERTPFSVLEAYWSSQGVESVFGRLILVEASIRALDATLRQLYPVASQVDNASASHYKPGPETPGKRLMHVIGGKEIIDLKIKELKEAIAGLDSVSRTHFLRVNKRAWYTEENTLIPLVNAKENISILAHRDTSKRLAQLYARAGQATAEVDVDLFLDFVEGKGRLQAIQSSVWEQNFTRHLHISTHDEANQSACVRCEAATDEPSHIKPNIQNGHLAFSKALIPGPLQGPNHLRYFFLRDDTPTEAAWLRYSLTETSCGRRYAVKLRDVTTEDAPLLQTRKVQLVYELAEFVALCLLSPPQLWSHLLCPCRVFQYSGTTSEASFSLRLSKVEHPKNNGIGQVTWCPHSNTANDSSPVLFKLGMLMTEILLGCVPYEVYRSTTADELSIEARYPGSKNPLNPHELAIKLEREGTPHIVAEAVFYCLVEGRKKYHRGVIEATTVPEFMTNVWQP